MALKYDRRGEEASIVDRWVGGLTWMAHPEEGMQRASHALVVDDEVWLVDPLDTDGIEDELDALGTVAGVVVLTNSHQRDADDFAERHDVVVHVPACFGDWMDRFDAQVEPFEDELGNTGFELVWEKDGKGWKEGILYHPERKTLVVADALMTSLFVGRNGELGLFPPFKFSPPRDELADLAVERVLVGHGEPIREDAQEDLDAALSVGRGGAAASVARAIPTFVRIAYTNLRE